MAKVVDMKTGKPAAKPKTAAKAPAAKGSVPGDNSKAFAGALTPEQRRGLMIAKVIELEKLITKQRTANSDIRNHRKAMKKLGFDGAEIDFALYLRSQPEAKIKQMFETQHRVAQYLAHPIGRQLSLFDKDRTPAVEVAFEEGKTASLSNHPAKPPHDASTPQGQAWLKGHAAGQEIIGKGFKPLKTEKKPTDEADLRPRFAQKDDGAPASA